MASTVPLTGGGYLFQRGGTWYVDLGQIAGRRFKRSLKTSDPALALRLGIELQIERRRRGLGLDDDVVTARKPIRWETARQELLDDVKLHLSKRTHSRYTAICKLHLDHFFAGRLVNSIDREAVNGYQAARVAEGGAPATINCETAVLGRIVGFQVELKRLPKSPIGRIKLLPAGPSRRAAITFEEYVRFRDMASSWGYLRPLIAVLFNAGLRKDEERKLKWDRVDFKTRLLRIAGSPGQDFKTKTRKERSVEMNDELYRELRAWEAASRLRFQSEYVFPGRDPKKPINDYMRAWKITRRAAGLGEHVTPHSLRHSFATRLTEMGVPDSIVMEAGGWKSWSAFRRYRHVSSEMRRAAVKRLDEGIADAAKPDADEKAT